MVKGRLNTAKLCPNDKSSRSYSLSASVVFATIKNSFGEGFIHVGENHIQVIVTRGGKELLRHSWYKNGSEK